MEKFIKKYDNKNLEDWGTVVSSEFKRFQSAMGNNLKEIAESIGAKVSWYSKGHYDQSAMFERDGKFAYFSYSNYRGRNIVNLHDSYVCFCRTARHEKDYTGGTNVNCSYGEVKDILKKLLS